MPAKTPSLINAGLRWITMNGRKLIMDVHAVYNTVVYNRPTGSSAEKFWT